MGLFGMLRYFSSCTGSLFFNYGYNVKNGKIYYKQPFPQPVLTLEDADVETFKVMSRPNDTVHSDNFYYAVDKHSVYYLGFKVPGGDGPTFQLLQENFAKDKGQCYYRGMPIEGADPLTFRTIDDKFSADKNQLYKRELKIDDDVSVFETFNEGNLVHTANTVCVYDQVVPIPVGATFKHFGFNYYGLGDKLYHFKDVVQGADVKTVTVLDNFLAKTAEHVYYQENIIEDADPASFKQLEAPYGKDDKHIFFFEKTIDGADLKTFEIINIKFQCARDKNAMYHEDKRIKNFTQADLVNKKECNSCNEAAIYFAEK